MDKQDEKRCKELRKKIFIVGYKGGMAHLASCFSALEIIYTLYLKGVMNYVPQVPDMPERDRFILSKGHAGLALYAVMWKAGFLTEEELNCYLQPGCHIGGEPCMRDLKGIEASTGSLGHGLSMGVGMALGQKLDGINAKTFVLVGDGESQEGSIWEGIMAGATLKLDNLTVILDDNMIQKMDFTEKIMGYPNWREKLESFGWYVKEVDGHNVGELEKCLKEKNISGKPIFIIAKTIKGKGVSIMEGNPIWHFKLPNHKQKKIFMEELEITEEEMR